ncbi:unnamed protein product [Oppiella nova]|uniref:Uncharacterized protein n=1 Tax=Oppiella nova TaxID=334625 RepID=A0A7R9L924_9ACAR|nr:unnamed protein product [Oppiella nova]CAG2156430.1 unnamed protein product [Oppiella nova]
MYFGALYKECSFHLFLSLEKSYNTRIIVERRFMKSPKVGFVSLGCPKALVDSERILTQLKTEGYDVASDYEGADLVVVNTCGFIESAVQESLDAIGEAMSANGRVIVTGCLEGCNHRCTFCIIPSMRGDLVSRPVGSVLNEAQALKKAGVKEVLVISQDTSAYGVDTKYKLDFWNGQPVKTKFYDMCEALGQLGIWVRLHYVYPYPHVDAVIDLMAQGKILPYLDIPFQHASPRILKLMKRPAHSENTLERLKLWREKCPELVIRSTFVVGFPGETEEDFQMLLDWLQEAKLDRVGCFTYSPVEGATANDLPDHVPEEIKQQRYERFMEVQQAISAEKLQSRIGQTMTVLVDDLEEEFPVAVARSYADAPEIDGNVFVEDIDKSVIKAGDLLEVEITDADEYDLFAKLIRVKSA